jgi:hypothetical protein
MTMRVQVTLTLDIDTTNIDGMSDMDHAVHQAACLYLAALEPTECGDGSFRWEDTTRKEQTNDK